MNFFNRSLKYVRLIRRGLRTQSGRHMHETNHADHYLERSSLALR